MSRSVRNMVHVVLYSADKAVILNIVHSELYRIIILYNNTIIIPSISLLPQSIPNTEELWRMPPLQPRLGTQGPFLFVQYG
jgi:hypothetical protein